MTRVVLGGGISGLSTAFYLSKKFNRGTVLYEGSERLGGWIKTWKRADGTYFEQGPRTLRYDAATEGCFLEMISEIGLESSIRQPEKCSKNRYFYVDNKLHALSLSFRSIVVGDPLYDEPIMKLVLKEALGRGKKINDESFHDFMCRRFGERFAEVNSALVSGIYAGDSKQISIRSTLPIIFDVEQMYGSIFRGFVIKGLKKMLLLDYFGETRKKRGGGIVSFDKGMETLPRALGEYLKLNGSTNISLNKKCERIEFNGREVRLMIDGSWVNCKHLYSSVPSKDLSKLLGDEHGFLKDELSKIPFVSVAVVNLEYKGDVLPVEGFGCLIPPNQNLPVLGIVFDSSVFPQGNKTILTVMMGGSLFRERLGNDPGKEYLLKIATDHVQKILNINEKPTSSLVSVLRDCIPQHVVGHTDRVKRMNDYITEKKLPLTLVGNSYYNVSAMGSIASAKLMVELHSK